MSIINQEFAPFAERMQREGLPQIIIDSFKYYYTQLAAGKTGLIPESAIAPIESLPDAEELPASYTQKGEAVLSKTILLKLNGGLGTSMGLNKAKTLLPIKDGLTFLDIIARQASNSGMPLVLMNSFNTQADSLAILKDYPTLKRNIPLDFLQHKVPKVAQADLTPVTYSANPILEWAPPGHGDIYTALVTSGMLDTLLSAGYEYAFVANADNLGAVMDAGILGYFAANRFPFMMEAADRTEADNKGGHLAKRGDGSLILRELAQTEEEDMPAFQNIQRHKFFNTNNLWLNLPALKMLMDSKNNILGLPMICNHKTVNPRDNQSTPVYQIETAMGSAIAVFDGAAAIRVPRTRFAPVKTTADLLAVRSDAYILTNDFRIIANPERKMEQILITLDANYYKLLDDFETRFPHGAPSLIACEKLTIQGNIAFGRDVVVNGDVYLKNKKNEMAIILDGTTL